MLARSHSARDLAPLTLKTLVIDEVGEPHSLAICCATYKYLIVCNLGCKEEKFKDALVREESKYLWKDVNRR